MLKKVVPVVLLVIAVVAVEALKRSKAADAAEGCAGGVCAFPIPQEAMAPVAAVEAAPLPRLLDLGSSSCIPCKTMAPILDEMRETFAGQLAVEFIDIRRHEGAGAKYGIRIIPTQIFFDAQGRELFRHEGFYSREDMLGKWKELGFEFREGA